MRPTSDCGGGPSPECAIVGSNPSSEHGSILPCFTAPSPARAPRLRIASARDQAARSGPTSADPSARRALQHVLRVRESAPEGGGSIVVGSGEDCGRRAGDGDGDALHRRARAERPVTSATMAEEVADPGPRATWGGPMLAARPARQGSMFVAPCTAPAPVRAPRRAPPASRPRPLPRPTRPAARSTRPRAPSEGRRPGAARRRPGPS